MKLVLIYLKNLNTIITNFLAFFLFLFKTLDPHIENADPDPGRKINADPCGSGSTAMRSFLDDLV